MNTDEKNLDKEYEAVDYQLGKLLHRYDTVAVLEAMNNKLIEVLDEKAVDFLKSNMK